ncbi:MerR family transcriptional regulator [Microcella daejeonensis]|uniref:MerR family transcriptional regulator n=1 Tax=Microcella daejeonensis TaxID=2994971 RepID=UPI00226E4F9B|nr:MerR family transcriptional regulator [Microcella daejeonensis]WAB83750.1 MerR family transcriptional regulator [Microcella daejeonensis]
MNTDGADATESEPDLERGRSAVMQLSIGELAERTGVSVRSLRYYEQQMLLSPARTSGGRRVYEHEDERSVARIQELFQAGFCSSVIREILLPLEAPADNEQLLGDAFTAARERLLSERDAIDAELANLSALADRIGVASHMHVISHHGTHDPEDGSPQQLRLIIETDDFDRALVFYRDVLGMPEQLAFATEGDDRVAILHAGIATIELATPTHARNIDDVENAPHTPGALRIALEVHNTQQAVEALSDHGVEVIASPVRTPFQSLNARVQGPDGWQVTLFQELETIDDRALREGFTMDDARPR